MMRQEFIITGDKDKSPDYWVYMIYVFLSANWDGILLAIAMCCVRWKQLVWRTAGSGPNLSRPR